MLRNKDRLVIARHIAELKSDIKSIKKRLDKLEQGCCKNDYIIKEPIKLDLRGIYHEEKESSEGTRGEG